MLLSKDDPSKVIGQSEEPVMEPEESWEQDGYVDHVVFPTAAFEQPDNPDIILVYYGAADEHCGVTAYDREELLATIKPFDGVH